MASGKKSGLSSADSVMKGWKKIPPALWTALGIVVLLAAGCYVFFNYVGFGDSVRVSATSPSAAPARKGESISIDFNKPVAPPDKLNKPVNENLVKISPRLKGIVTWELENRILFTPSEPYRPGVKYRVALKNGLVSEFGKSLIGRKSFAFRSEPLKIVSANLYSLFNPGTFKIDRIRGELKFNYPVSKPELLKRVRAVSTGKKRIEMELAVEASQGDLVHTFTTSPIDHGAAPSGVEISVDQGLLSSMGGRSMDEPFSRTVVLDQKEERKVTDVRPIFDAAITYLQLTFNMPVDAAAAARFIRVNPDPGYTVEASQSILKLKGNFKAGGNYEVTLKEGLPGKDGSVIKKEQSFNVSINDLPSKISFERVGRYLPRSGGMKVGFQSVNVKRIRVTVSRINRNNLIYYLNRGESYYFDEGYFLHSLILTNINISAERNKEVRGYIDLSNVINAKLPGIYRVELAQAYQSGGDGEEYYDDYYYNREKLNVIVTELGIFAKRTAKDLLVFINHLDNFKSVSGARVSVLSRDNQELMKGETDSQGFLLFSDVKARIESRFGSEAPQYEPYAVVVEKGDDFAYLKFESGRVNTSVFEIGGYPYTQNEMQAFLYAERGVYRPGEDVHLTAIVRSSRLAIPPSMPLILRIIGPTGAKVTEVKGELNDGGMVTYKVNIPSYEKTGAYYAELLIGKDSPIGSADFRVEDFIPDKIKVELEPAKTVFRKDAEIEYKVKGINLFGPPASGARVRSEIRYIDEAFRPKEYPDYVFEVYEKRMKDYHQSLSDQTLDENGIKEYSVMVPYEVVPQGLLKAVIYAEVQETGGRAVGMVKSVRIKKNPFFLGIKKMTKESEVNRPIEFSVVSVNEEGKKTDAGRVKITVYKIEYKYTSRWNGSYYEWKYETREQLEYEKVVPAIKGDYTISFTPKSYHQHRILVEAGDGTPSAELKFYPYSYWDYWTTMDMSFPGKLQVKLDKAVYKAGENARVTVSASGPGLLLLTVEMDRVVYKKVVRMSKNSITVAVPVAQEMAPNFYITAAVLRHFSLTDSDKPMREFGIASAALDMKKNRLDVSLELPKSIRPKSKVKTRLKVKNAKGKAYLTVMAVDEGICQITGFSAPDPFRFFTRKRALGVDSFDTWNDIISDIRLTEKMLSVGGDGGPEAEDRKHLNPVSVKRVKPVCLFSGLVKLNWQGEADVDFDIPMFNGTLRVMAVAASEDRFGSGEKMLLVTDPVVITSSLPRFIAPGDRFKIPIKLFNKTGKKGKFSLKLDIDGPVEIAGNTKVDLNIENDREAAYTFDAKAKMSYGKVVFTVRAEGNEIKTEETTELALRPSGQRTSYFETGRLDRGGSVALKVPDTFIGKPDIHLVVSKTPLIRYVGSLKYLIGYPYGCLEQITSKAMPMLFIKDVLRLVDPNEFARLGGDYYITEAVRRVESMLDTDRGFTFWPGYSYYYNYTTAYASHFLLEAARKGYTVSKSAENQCFVFLSRIAKSDVKKKIDEFHFYNALEEIVYALYILARFNQPDRQTMIYIREHHFKSLPDHGKAMLAAAFAYTGDRATAKSLIPSEFKIQERYSYYTYGGFYSYIRTVALCLDALLTVSPGSPQVANLMARLERGLNRYGTWGSTQENAFALMALSRALGRDLNTELSGNILADNKVIREISGRDVVIKEKAFAGKSVSIKMAPNSVCYYTWCADGFPLTPDRRYMSEGLKITRRFLNKNGTAADLNSVKQGDTMIVELVLESTEKVDNVALVDMLPGGFEIENTRLRMTGEIGWLPERSDEQYVDIRDDRIIYFTGFAGYGDHVKKFYYAVRAVTEGSFTLPTVYAEAMYDPLIRAQNYNQDEVFIMK